MEIGRLRFFAIALLLLTFAAPACAGAAVVETVLYPFNGNRPNPDLVLGGSTLYGMTSFGGDYGSGTIFKIGTSGGYEVLYSFQGGTDGAYPYGGLTLSADGSTLYGMTSSGGDYGYGTVFKISTGGSEWGYEILYSFQGGNDGGLPYGSLTLDGATLYGMTNFGGGNDCEGSGCGTVFKISTDGWESGYAILHSFQGGTDGAKPYGSLTLDGATLYGMTNSGGDYGYGTVFKIGTDGSESGYAILHSFQGGTDGASPYGSLTLSADGSTLYGATYSGGGANDRGTVFRTGTSGPEAGYAILHSFQADDGAYPYYGSLTLDGSTLYGTTYLGGAYSCGTVFKIGASGSGYEVLYSFKGVSSGDGSTPQGSLVLDGGTLFGTTNTGGENNSGTVFKIEGATAIDLVSFTAKGSTSKVTLAWETGSETDNAGFNLLRSLAPEAKYAQINSGLIPAEGSLAGGAKYKYVDQKVNAGTTYYYKLEDVDNTGVKTLHGPVSAKAAAAAIALVSPKSSSTFPGVPPALQWEGSGVTQFRVQFSKYASFAGKKLTFSRRLQGSSYTPKVSEWKAVKRFMGKSKTLYWRVIGKKAGGQTVASQPFNFKKK